MEKLIIDYLEKNWNKEHTKKIQFSIVPKESTGDLAINFFQLTKILGKSPVQIAQEIQSILEKFDILEKTEIAGPYLNLFFKNDLFFQKVLKTPFEIEILKGQKIMVEFSSPNTNKPLHLGHMRNHALGLALSNILKKAGAEVIKTTIFNDRGVHICKSMLAYKYFGNNESPESVEKKSDHFVGDYYVKFEEALKEKPTLTEEAQEMLLEWEKGNKEVKKLWKKMNSWAYEGYEKTYARQGLKFDKKYYESNLYKTGKEYVLEGFKKRILKKTDDGAIYLDLEEIGLDKKVLLRGNGTTVYMTQDLGTTVLKQKDFKPNQQIWIVADEQNYHFKVLFFALEKLGLLSAKNLYHLGYGLVHLPDGRMKSREGNVVDADNLMDELHEIAAQKIKEQNREFSDKTIYKTAEQIQNAAWKFYLLKTSPIKSMTFDKENSIDFQGATGPYLQYAGVRIKSILEKAEDVDSKISKKHFTEKEKPLGIKILEWPKALERAALEKNPTFVVTYLLELTQTWSSFYSNNSILKADSPELINARLSLAKKVLEILTSGLEGLGIEIPERM